MIGADVISMMTQREASLSVINSHEAPFETTVAALAAVEEITV